MELRRKGTIYVYVALTTALWAFTTNIRADHATNFLNELHQNITNRLATDTNLSRPEERALANAARTLERNSATLPADLKLLSTAASQLNAKFSEDETLTDLQSDAVSDYSEVAHTRMNQVHLWINTNSLNKSLRNQVTKAEDALDRADGVSNNVPAQARALSLAFTKILPLEKKVRSMFPTPIAPPPPPPPVTNNTPNYEPPPAVAAGTPGLAPDTFGTKHVDLSESAVVNDQTKFYFSTASSGAQIYNVHNPEELGLWYYVRTAANEGVIVVDPDYPDNAPRRPLYLTFTSPTQGTFTGTDYFGVALTGTFVVVE